MTSYSFQSTAETEKTSWWHAFVNPTVMFPNLPHTVAIILYSCIVIGIFIALMAFLWLCSSLAGKKKKSKKTSDLRMQDMGAPWSITGKHGLKREKEEKVSSLKQNGDTLKHLESMPWWDFVSSNPSVNWYDYYRMAEGRNRSKSYDRRRLKSAGKRPREKMRRNGSDHYQCLSPEADPCWERVHPHNVDIPWYWRGPRSRDTRFFPRFRMIPRASWSNQHLLGCISPNPSDYCNSSVASLTSADMQIMHMVAKREQKYLRPNRGDVFFGQYVGHVPPRRYRPGRNSGSDPSPYDDHNQRVAQRQASRSSHSGQMRQSSPHVPTPLPGLNQTSDFTDLNGVCTTPPPPPEYPPPPTPVRLRNDVEL